MNNKNKEKKVSGGLKIQTVLVYTFLILAVFTILYSVKANNFGDNKRDIVKLAVQEVKAEEVYDEFVCGCCGRALDPSNICCGDMRQKIEYIDDLAAKGMTKDELIMKAVKEFGFNALAKAETKQEIKQKLADQAPQDAPQILLAESYRDLGIVKQADGVISTLFELKNTGQGPLVIDKLSTSCGCTSASIVYQGNEGPSFTMPGHGKDNPQNWQVSVAPGDSAKIKVYYDPNAHGPQKKVSQSISRTISVFSNDPIEFEKQLRIELEQIK